MITAIKKAFSKLKNFVFKYRKTSLLLAIILLVICYYGYTSLAKGSTKTSYVTSTVTRGTIITSVSGSGQVSASEQLDVKAKASGDIVYIGVLAGQTVKAGQLIAQINSRNAQQAVENAQTNLNKVQLNLEKMQGLTTDEGTIRGDRQKAQDTLNKSYEDGFSDISNVFLSMPSTISGLHDILFNYTANNYQQNIDWYLGQAAATTGTNPKEYGDQVTAAYNLTSAAYDKNFNDFKLVSRTSSKDTIYNLILETYDTAQKLSDAIKITGNFIDYVKKSLTDHNFSVPSLITTHQSALNGYTGTANGYLSTLLSDKSTIDNNKEALINTGFSIQDQQIQVDQAQQSLDDAKATLADYYVRAPFDGIIASLNYKKGDSASNGSTVATVITTKGITEIPFNEVDISKIKAGQKANLTFDAIDGLTIVGQVAQIDVLGTVTQGVVNYNVTIAFDAQNSQVKPGMSVSANVITDVKQDVLTAPNSAVKQQGNISYVEIMTNGVPEQKQVEIGLSNDTDTEIVSGIQEGETIITQTISSSTTTSSTQGSSSLNIPGITGGGGSSFRSFSR